MSGLTNRLPTLIAERWSDDEYFVTVLRPLGACKTDTITANCAEDAIEKMARIEGIDDYAFRVRD